MNAGGRLESTPRFVDAEGTEGWAASRLEPTDTPEKGDEEGEPPAAEAIETDTKDADDDKGAADRANAHEMPDNTGDVTEAKIADQESDDHDSADSDADNPATAPLAVTREPYRPELDGIRAFCIIFTVLNHVPGKPAIINGMFGVDVFFALSGWLITWLLMTENRYTGNIQLRSFYIRRFFRIVPLYFLTVAIYVILTFVGAKAGGVGELKTALPYMLTFNMEFRPASAGNLFGHAWSLGIEEKFYLVWPILVWLTRKRPTLNVIVVMLAFTILFLTPGIRLISYSGYLGLGFGATLAIIVASLSEAEQWSKKQRLAGPLLMSMIIIYAASIVWPQPAIWDVLMSLVAAAIIANLWCNTKQRVAKWLTAGPLPWLGRLTFAIYLIQSIVIRGAETVMSKLHLGPTGIPLAVFAYGTCVLLAWAAHVLIEKPLIRLGKRMSKSLKPMRRTGGIIPSP